MVPDTLPYWVIVGRLTTMQVVAPAYFDRAAGGSCVLGRPGPVLSSLVKEELCGQVTEGEMSNKLKDAGTWLLGIVALLAILAIPALFLVGAEWLSERLLAWFIFASTLALAFVVFVALPLSVFRRCRRFSAIATLVDSYVFGGTLWMWALLLTLALWGTWAVVIGLFMMGVGVVPIAMLATLFKGMWSILGQLVVLIFLTFGSRSYAHWIGNRADAPEEM